MSTVRLSRDYGLVLPPPVRSALDLKPGQRLRVRRNGDHIEIVPLGVSPVRKATRPAPHSAKRRQPRDNAALLAQDRAGYLRQPDHLDDLSVWDRVLAWPDD